MSLVFTYGTLMKGQAAYGKFGEIEFFGDGVLRDYGIYEEDGFPAAVPVRGFAVYGEIYEVTDDILHKFDEYEIEGSLYIRRLVEIEVGPKVFDAWFYEYNRDISDLELRAPIGKWTPERKPVSDYAWYVCYGSNLLGERFDKYMEKVRGKVYAEKPYMLKGKIYFAKNSSTWNNSGVCFLDLKKTDRESYGWAYLVDRSKIAEISREEGKTWYPVQELGKDEYGIDSYTVTNDWTECRNRPCIEYLTVIAAGLQQRFNLTQNEIRRYLDCNERIRTDRSFVKDIIEHYCR